MYIYIYFFFNQQLEKNQLKIKPKLASYNEI